MQTKTIEQLQIGDRFVNPLNGSPVEYAGVRKGVLSDNEYQTYRIVLPNGKTNYNALLGTIPRHVKVVTLVAI